MQVVDGNATNTTKPAYSHFNRENAKLYAAQAVLKRRLNKIERVKQSAELEQSKAVAEVKAGQAPCDDYRAKRLLRVRKQISRLETMLDDEQDPQKIDRLCSALARLSEIERQLAGRALPGSLKPASLRQPRQSSQAEPIEPA